MARFMIVRGSEPLAGARVRVEGSEATRTTDKEGRFEANVDEDSVDDSLVVKVRHGNGTYKKEIDFDPKVSLVIVNVEERHDTGGDGPLHSTESGSFAAGGEALRERYDVQGRLGTGGMGVVVKAEDTVLERTVAIKILSEELASYDEAREIFMREVRNLATLDHPNLVSVYDVVENAKRPLMITEYIDGLTLEQVIQSEEVLPQSSVLKIAVQLARAVEYLHSEEIVHRDLKPGNIMLKEDGTLKLIDFGLARTFKHLSNKSTRVRGTPAYMAPEQIEGDELSKAIDIYQIGVTLHEVASGRLPFAEGDIGYKHVHEEPPNLGDLVPNILPGLADLVRVSLSKEPDDRPASATALREEAERLHHLLTSSRIDRDHISNPNIGGASDANLRQAKSNSGVEADASSSASNISQSGVDSSSSGAVSASDESVAREADSSMGGWGRSAFVVAALIVAGLGGYFAFAEYGGERTEGDSGALAEAAESEEADPSGEERDEEPETTSAQKREGDSREVVPSASTEIERAVAASQAAVDTVGEEGEEGTAGDDGARGERPRAGAKERGSRSEKESARTGSARAVGEPSPSGGGGSGSEGSTERAEKSAKSGSDDEDSGAEPAKEREEEETGSSDEVRADSPDESAGESAVAESKPNEPEDESGDEEEEFNPFGSGSKYEESEDSDSTEPDETARSEPSEPSESKESREEKSDEDEESESSGSVPMSF